jgi:hypothetical protein
MLRLLRCKKRSLAMAYLYERKDSKYWWIKIKKDGKWIPKSTGFLKDSAEQTRKAQKICAQFQDQKLKINSEDCWENWVDKALQNHCHDPQTLARYRGSWAYISSFFELKKIRRPLDVTHQVIIDYKDWRKAQQKPSGKFVSHNTALIDLKILRIVLRNAVWFGYVTHNAAEKTGLKKEEVVEKIALSDDDIQQIRGGLKGEPEWMKICFEIALYTGCRLRETQLDFADVDFEEKIIFFPKPKGGIKKAYFRPLPDDLVPMLKEIQSTGAKRAVILPRMAAKEWWDFFKNRLHRKDICFHCTRVTYSTRLALSGVPESFAMRLTNHKSLKVHRGYQKFHAKDLAPWAKQVQLPPFA